MKLEFKAIIQQHENMNAAFIEPPFDIPTVFGAKRVKVKATFNGLAYRGSLVNMGGCYMLGLTQEIRNKIGMTFGDEIDVTIEKDEEERTVEIPEEFATELAKNPKATETFNGFSYSSKREYVLWITSAKREETRLDRIQKAISMLNEGKKLK